MVVDAVDVLVFNIAGLDPPHLEVGRSPKFGVGKVNLGQEVLIKLDIDNTVILVNRLRRVLGNVGTLLEHRTISQCHVAVEQYRVAAVVLIVFLIVVVVEAVFGDTITVLWNRRAFQLVVKRAIQVNVAPLRLLLLSTETTTSFFGSGLNVVIVALL